MKFPQVSSPTMPRALQRYFRVDPCKVLDAVVDQSAESHFVLSYGCEVAGTGVDVDLLEVIDDHASRDYYSLVHCFSVHFFKPPVVLPELINVIISYPDVKVNIFL